MGIKIHKLAGIDIGSNSVRLLVSNVLHDHEKDEIVFKKSSLTRLPVRLGTDAFKKGKISKKNIRKLVKSMRAYADIMEVHGVDQYRACATSALREADNGEEIVERIYKKTGVQIELIDGEEEARIIFSSEMIENIREEEDTFLYIDVGGGSTELTLFHQGRIRASQSFRVGTIRLLKNIVKKEAWEDMKQWIKQNTRGLDKILMVGSGGNINRTFKMSGKKVGEFLEYEYILDTQHNLMQYTAEERMVKFDLNPDRADVITHALKIYTRAMKWAKSEQMLVPKKGLADGIVRYLYRENYHPGSLRSNH